MCWATPAAAPNPNSRADEGGGGRRENIWEKRRRANDADWLKEGGGGVGGLSKGKKMTRTTTYATYLRNWLFPEEEKIG